MTTTLNAVTRSASAASKSPDIAILVYCLEGGGVQRQTITLATHFAARGLKVAYVVVRATGELAGSVPNSVELVELLPGRGQKKPSLLDRVFDQIRALPALTAYLRDIQPKAVLTGGSHMNFSAVMTHRKARSSAHLVLRLTTHMSHARGRFNPLRWLASLGASTFYPHAHRIVAVSEDVRSDFLQMVEFDPARIEMIREPVITPRIGQVMDEPVAHPWLAPDQPPVILAIGRISVQKDFETLLRAFADVRERRPARLIVLGAAVNSGRAVRLLNLAQALGVAGDIDFPGYTMNPYSYLARAAVFALSSRFEGCPNVLAEAVYCGCPIVATDCPGGIREVVSDDKIGTLVPVADAAAMGAALLATIERGRTAAARLCPPGFDVETSVSRYLAACRAVG